MREILFRARHSDPYDTHGWFYGYYERSDNTYHYIIEENGSIIPINPKTLYQFTGRYDKDGVRIFEGDIVRLSLPLAKDLVYTAIGKIVYDESCSFSCETISKKVGTFPLAPDFNYEVIGNIYDNPELLEEANDR